MTSTIGYEVFVPRVVLAFHGKKKDDNQLTESEVKQATALIFRDAVIQFMKDSLLYREEIPIDVYEGVQRYDIIPPEGYIVEDIVSIKEHKIKIPNNCYDLKNITLTCCPTKDVDQAFYVEVALSARRIGGDCKFDGDFVEMHYEAILEYMVMILADTYVRSWTARTSVESHRRGYLEKVSRAKRQSVNGGGIIKLHRRRLSDGSTR